MRWLGLLATLSAFSSLVLSSPLGDPAEPEVLASAEFPESNPFGQVVNGERNQLTVNIENKSDKNVTLLSIAGSLSHPDTGILVKNLTSASFNFPLIEGVKIQLPYTFYSEFKPGDLRLNIWLEHALESEKYRVVAYDSVVSIVEPEGSWFDFKMITTYLMVTGILGGLGYVAYLNLAPQPKKKTRKPVEVSEPVGTVTATGAGGYQEEWIPEHHIRKAGKKKGGNATSGDELSGGETSGAEAAGAKKRKGRK